jgi:hypothetical protein
VTGCRIRVDHFHQTTDGDRAACFPVGERVGDSDDASHVLERRTHHFQDDFFLGLKLVVHGSFTDPDTVGDHLERRAMHPVLGKQGECGIEDSFPGEAPR